MKPKKDEEEQKEKIKFNVFDENEDESKTDKYKQAGSILDNVKVLFLIMFRKLI